MKALSRQALALSLATAWACGEEPAGVLSEPLAVENIAPAPGSVDVPLDIDVVATFSEPLAPASVGASSVFLLDASGAAVAASLSLTTDMRSVVLGPDQPLTFDSVYSLQLTTALSGESGRGLAAEVSASFRTRAQ